MNSSAFNFNKEILFGECGAFIFANLVTLTISHFTKNATLISACAVVGTLTGGALFWLIMRIYDRIHAEGKKFNAHEITSDISYFTPAALILGTFIYDPILYVISNYLLKSNHAVETSVIIGQITAFSCFLICMNIYRIILIRFKLKVL